MDFTKFLSLLENRKLFFARADQFEDPYEGMPTRASIIQFRDSSLKRGLPEESIEQFIATFEQMRRSMFISCWCSNEQESAAMWKLYLQSPEGVAVRSDHDALTRALDGSPLRARTTVVNYVDYNVVPIPLGNLFFPFVTKRLSFAHENEVRAIIWSLEDVNRPQVQADVVSLTIDIVPDDLIKAVHVAPTAPKWFGQLVEQLLQRYNLNVLVERSSLYDRPSY